MRGYTKIPRNRNCKPSQYKFEEKQENKLTEWMESNLIFYYRVVKNPSSGENELIKKHNPLLNIQNNGNEKNSEFRKKLKELRKNVKRKT